MSIRNIDETSKPIAIGPNGRVAEPRAGSLSGRSVARDGKRAIDHTHCVPAKEAERTNPYGPFSFLEEQILYKRCLKTLQKGVSEFDALCSDAHMSSQVAYFVVLATYTNHHLVSDSALDFLLARCEGERGLIEDFAREGKNDPFVIQLLCRLPADKQKDMCEEVVQIVFRFRQDIAQIRAFIESLAERLPFSPHIVQELEHEIAKRIDRQVLYATNTAVSELQERLASVVYELDSACGIGDLFFTFIKELREIQKEAFGYQVSAVSARCMEAIRIFFGALLEKSRGAPVQQDLASPNDQLIVRLRRVHLALALCSLVDRDAYGMVEPSIQGVADEIEKFKNHPVWNSPIQGSCFTPFERFIDRVREHLGPFRIKFNHYFDQILQHGRDRSNQTLDRAYVTQSLSEVANHLRRCPRLETVKKEDSDPDADFPSVKALIQEFSSRPWSPKIFCSEEDGHVSGIFPSVNLKRAAVVHALDQDRLLKIIRIQNGQFAKRISILGPNDFGTLEKLEVDRSTVLYVRGDLHSNITSLLADLEMLKQEGLLDEEYGCCPGFHMIFLGDYLDRGVNDIELLTLVLCLRMMNPSSVHLLRGNHEDVQFLMSTERDWFEEHSHEVDSCFKSLPLGLCVGERSDSKKSGEQQYVFFSHGAVSLGIDLAPLLTSDATVMTVPEFPDMAPTLTKGAKQQKALHELSTTAQTAGLRIAASLYRASGIIWNDPGARTGPSDRGIDAAVISSQDLHRYAQAAGSGDRKIKGFVFGHAHAFQEFCVMGTTRFRKKKVLATTLGCVWTKGPSLDNVSGQGLLIRVAPKVSRWTKQLIILEGRGLDTQARVALGEVGMYEPFYH